MSIGNLPPGGILGDLGETAARERGALGGGLGMLDTPGGKFSTPGPSDNIWIRILARNPSNLGGDVGLAAYSWEYVCRNEFDIHNTTEKTGAIDRLQAFEMNNSPDVAPNTIVRAWYGTSSGTPGMEFSCCASHTSSGGGGIFLECPLAYWMWGTCPVDPPGGGHPGGEWLGQPGGLIWVPGSQRNRCGTCCWFLLVTSCNNPNLLPSGHPVYTWGGGVPFPWNTQNPPPSPTWPPAPAAPPNCGNGIYGVNGEFVIYDCGSAGTPPPTKSGMQFPPGPEELLPPKPGACTDCGNGDCGCVKEPMADVAPPDRFKLSRPDPVLAAALDVWTVVDKTADEARASNTSAANDGQLLFTMAANAKYRIHIFAWWDAGDAAGGGGFRYALTGPASPTLVRVKRQHMIPGSVTGAEATQTDTAYTTTQTITPTAQNGGWVEMDIIVHNGANGGTFAFQWAQNTSDTDATTVRAGSSLKYKRVG